MWENRKALVNTFVIVIAIVFSECTSQTTTQVSAYTVRPGIHATSEKTVFPEKSLAPYPYNRTESTLAQSATPIPSFSIKPTNLIKTKTPPPDVKGTLAEQVIEQDKTLIASLANACDDAYISRSPEGNWSAVSCGYKRDQSLHVVSKTGKKWLVLFKDYVSKEYIRDGQTPMGGLSPDHWTNDGMYLYFRSAIAFSGGGRCSYHDSGQGLYRLNLENGAISATLEPLIGPDAYIIAFSPNGQWLAYNTGIPTILNLQTGESIVLQEGGKKIGDFAWSPDSLRLAYGACQVTDHDPNLVKSSVMIFSLSTRQTETILEVNGGFLTIRKGQGSSLVIHDEYYDKHPKYFYYYWSIDKLILPTLTVTP